MNISNRGLTAIKAAEGLRLRAYKCPAGVWTVGYGHTRGVRKGMTITPEIAEQLLIEDVKSAEAAVRKIPRELTQGQFDCLCSFIFSVGEGRFLNSTLRKKIIAREPDEAIVAELKRWVYSGRSVLQGLVRRREAEARLWLS
jgi:lysozyme